ncbi:MAG: aminodeoxychorismate/anthranilate synthase component II [Pseudodesulfovibrio sp.]|nr:aminodeoxychorismate/anthranilate synthase component II [Pseudodesulfovibrio sp.]
MDILLIDNNDSFTHNLEHLLAISTKSASIIVESHANLTTLAFSRFDLIVISPGPGAPVEYPGYERIFASGKPVLGICLGMQIMNEYCGGRTGRLQKCMHGKTDTIVFNGTEHIVARYHSLYVTQLGNGLEILAENADFVPMCLGNRSNRWLGYQFHPESFLTPHGGAFIDHALDYLDLG